MQETLFSTVILPLVIFAIMTTLGLTLTLDDFRRLFKQRRLVLVGMLSQLVLLPVLGFGLAFLWQDTPYIAIGLVLMAACPGGPASNLIVHATDGNRPLSVTLTAISSVLAFVTIPLLVGIAFDLFADESAQVRLPFLQTAGQIAFLTVIPLSIGMVGRARYPDFAIRTQERFKFLGGVALATIVIILLIQERQTFVDFIASVGPPTLLMCLTAVFMGGIVARLFGLDDCDTMTLGVETGMQNAPLAITVALTVLNDPDLALLPGAYGLFETPLIFLIAIGLSRLWSLSKMVMTSE